MKKVLVTAPGETGFTGEVELVYGEEGMNTEALRPLLVVDFKNAVLNDTQKKYILANAPVRYAPGYEQNWGPYGDRLRIIVTDHVLDFDDDFYIPYGNPENRKRCLAIWDKMSKNKRAAACFGVSPYLRFLSECTYARAKASPESYLRKEMWLTDWSKVNR